MAVRLGHAVCDEKSKAKGGKAGDNTTKEVTIWDWYSENNGWDYVLRAKDEAVAEKIAKAMEQAVTNEKIGYDQGQRTTLYTEALKVGFDLSKIEKACECDCSSLVAVCVNAAGISVSKDIYTGNMVKTIYNTGKFDKYNTKEYLTSSDYLKRGDILVNEGSHTAIVLNNGEKAVDYKFVSYIGKVTAFWLNVREGASSKTKSLKTIKKDTLVTITKEKGGWGYVSEHKGWVSLSYIKEQEEFKRYIASTITTVNFRTAPNSNNKNNIITKFNKGQVLLIINENGNGWVYGKTTIDGQVKNGWIFEEYLQRINEKSLQKRRVTDATGLNIRDKGNINASMLDIIPRGKDFFVIKDGSWGVVAYKDTLGYSSLFNGYSERV